jgi:hypothetical protein
MSISMPKSELEIELEVDVDSVRESRFGHHVPISRNSCSPATMGV